jgi:hypothetical protein
LIHPDTELRRVDDQIGFGVFATRLIPAGTIVWVLDELDQRLDPAHVLELGPRYAPLLERYTYLNPAGERILCWDIARFLNHSCEANVISTGWNFDVAVRDIEAGEEITNDYGCLNLEESFQCLCRRPGCRGTVRPTDFVRFADRWDASTRAVLPQLPRVAQPLWAWVAEQQPVSEALRDPERMPSIRRHRYAPTRRPRLRRVVARTL